MNFIFIAALDYFHIEQKIFCTVGFERKLTLTNDREKISILINDFHISQIGKLEYNYLLSGRPVLYVERKLVAPQSMEEMLLDFLREIQSFCGEMWLWRDNSINCQQAFALAVDVEALSVNCLPVFNSSATGEDVNITVKAEEFHSLIDGRIVQFDSFKERTIPKQTSLRKSMGRLNVGLYHLQAARNHRDLGFKIACYCSFFESLFSTDTAELSHQLSQRIAFFLHDDPEKRIELYKLTKKAYAVRSKAVHGDNLDSSVAHLKNLAVHCDSLARACLLKIFGNKKLYDMFSNSSRETIANYLAGMIFGIS
ncbi:HEPN domain-containing protein [Pseudomonas syringae]|uniref:HEPN domain-containing protein n=2 Tax=Pseudomonas syringae TaxID=317 RepID=UPI0011D2BD52|nr:HEPN domain-containing protein [Pseudomonas syringae]